MKNLLLSSVILSSFLVGAGAIADNVVGDLKCIESDATPPRAQDATADVTISYFGKDRKMHNVARTKFSIYVNNVGHGGATKGAACRGTIEGTPVCLYPAGIVYPGHKASQYDYSFEITAGFEPSNATCLMQDPSANVLNSIFFTIYGSPFNNGPVGTYLSLEPKRFFGGLYSDNLLENFSAEATFAPIAL